jgi:O-antigen/teichoic acid export membrane protein
MPIPRDPDQLGVETEPSEHDRTLEAEVDLLRSAEVGPRVVRGGALRGIGYAGGLGLVAIGSVLLLRYLGVADFGRYVTVTALIGIVSGVSDAGLTTIGARELSIAEEARRPHLMANLITLRLVLTPIGVAVATLFAIVAGYDHTMVYGTILAGLGLVLVSTQATLTLPLAVKLSYVRLTVGDLIKQATTVAGMGVCVLLGTSLLPFFGLQIVVGLVVIATTPLIVGRHWWHRPRADRGQLRLLVREALPMATALALNVIYFRTLVIIASLIATAVETGYVATSFRIFEILLGVPTIVMGVALPVLSAAADDGGKRLHYVIQRMTEVGFAGATFIAIMIVFLAGPVIELLGGHQYAGAASVLRIQGFSLIGLFLGQAWQLGLVSIRRQRDVAVANAIALVVVISLGLALIPWLGADGAGLAAVGAETLLSLILLFMLYRRDLGPDLRFLWKVGLAAVLALAPLLAPGLPEVAGAAIAAVLFLAVAWVTKMVPPEVIDAFGLRRVMRA